MQPLVSNPEANQLTPNGSLQPGDLIRNARNSSAICNSHQEAKPNHVELPSWIDPEAIKTGRNFIRRHFFLIFFTHFISLLLLLSYVPVRMVLLKTKRSHTTELALTRYLSTLRHVKLWYEGDLTCGTSQATKDVIKIRQIHSGVYKRLQDNPPPTNLYFPKNDGFKTDLIGTKSKSILDALQKCGDSGDENNNLICNHRETSPHIISQLDMIVTQYCFMGLLTSFPEKFGLSPSSSKQDSEGLKGFIHIWAVIGHHLGIQDDFNLCIGNKSPVKEHILHKILMKDLSTSDADTFMLWEALVSAMSEFVPCLSLRAALLYFLDYTLKINYDISALYSGATFYDLFCYKFTIILVNRLFSVTAIRNTFSNLLRLAIYLTSMKLGFQRKLANM